MKTVIGLFAKLEDAHGAYEALVMNKAAKDRISVVTRPPEKGHSSEAAEGAGVGAAAGAVTGGAAGLLASLGAFMIPGIGPVLGLGTLLATLTAAGVGAAAGGAIGGLIGLGIPAHEAERYAEGIKRGGSLIAVQADDADADRIAETLSTHGAVDIDERDAQWKASGWKPAHAPELHVRNQAQEAQAIVALESGNIGGPRAAQVRHGVELGDVANTGASIGSIGVGLGEGIGDVAGNRRYNARIYNPA